MRLGAAVVGVAAAVACAATPPSCPRGTAMSGAGPPDGVRMVCSYPDGRRSDVTEWWPGGGRQSAGSLVDERREGSWTFWYLWGRKMEEGEFRAGERDGVWRRWHPSGQLAVTATYAAGRLHGPWRLFYPDGAPHRAGHFADGVKLGTWVEWTPHGERIETRYEAGRAVSRREFPKDTPAPP